MIISSPSIDFLISLLHIIYMTTTTKSRLAKNQTITPWGTSAAVRISKAMMTQSGFSLGLEVELVPVPDGLLLRPVRPKYSLKELVAQMNDSNRPEYIDSGIMGKEVI